MVLCTKRRGKVPLLAWAYEVRGLCSLCPSSGLGKAELAASHCHKRLRLGVGWNRTPPALQAWPSSSPISQFGYVGGLPSPISPNWASWQGQLTAGSSALLWPELGGGGAGEKGSLATSWKMLNTRDGRLFWTRADYWVLASCREWHG